MITANPGQIMVPTEGKTITIKGIELHTQARRKLPVARHYYVQFSVGDTSQSTDSAKEQKNQTLWDKILYFDGDDRSVLAIKVYQKHHIGKDTLIGNLTGTIGGVVGKLKDGGAKGFSMACSTDAIFTLKVLEETLCKDISDQSVLPGITIKFALVTELRGDVNADERQARDAVTRATETVDALGSMPAAIGLLGSVVDTGTNVMTEVQTFENTWGVLLTRLTLFNKIVGSIAQIHPYTSLAWSVISGVSQVFIDQKNRDDQIIHLAGVMSDVFTFVHDAEPLKAIEAHIKIITLLIQQVTECGYFITEYTKSKSFLMRTAKYVVSDIGATITGYENKLQELKTAFLEGVAVQTEITVVRMMNVVEHVAESIDLNDMPYAIGARYVREKGCLEGTRESVIQNLCEILSNPNEDAPRVCLLTGIAGSGKSAVAHSIARLYDEQGRLGSSYCFASGDVAKRNPQNLFTTIARDLCDHDEQYKSALWGVVKSSRALRTSTSLLEQVQKLIVEPCKHLDAIGPLLIVIDALDESGDEDSRREILDIISHQIADANMPTNLRFLITARPESDILSTLASCSRIIRKHLGDEPLTTVDEDIGKFIRHSLSDLPELESSWPDQEWCRLLVEHSQHIFQWASTACKFIQGDGAKGVPIRKRLRMLIQNTDSAGIHPLDKIYRTILGHLFTLRDAQESFQEVMAVVLALKEPLPLTSLTVLFDRDLDVQDIIEPMGSLLDGVMNKEKPIRPLHSSFRDFLQDEARSSTFHVRVGPQQSLSVGSALVGCMENMLKFNICGLKDSREYNAAIPDLPSRVKEAIPPHLAYSCQYWMVHLQDVECTPDLLQRVTLFFKGSFPYWLEVISLLSLSSPVLFTISAIETCMILEKWAKGQEIAILASEASRFIQVFAPILRESTPHLYLSAMPQTPSSSPLCGLWASRLRNHVSVTSGHPASWPADIHTLQGHTDYVTSVAYSPDGTQIVSGSEDTTIRVWNATTGQLIAGPFQGHTESIWSAAYSPGGSRIVSGSKDKTIRVWSAATGQLVAGPFEGHTNSVTCVAYSPDGSRIVSGSEDNTVRIWNATTGQTMVGPLQGHTDEVWSVAYSPDGSRIVSGSDDETIRVWNATTGEVVGDPFQGHTNAVIAVTYSPDGSRITSGSKDNTIRVWDAATGRVLVGPFQGHTDNIWSVVYSLDGSRIVSGSADKTVLVWDAATGRVLAGPFQGHTDSISSVAYSPDSSQFVSGSWDLTIRVWNATAGQLVASQHQGHTGAISCVAYSPDGSRIVSGSEDNTIRVWDATTGQLVAGPFQGHTDYITSIAYSPDSSQVASGSEDNTVRIWSATTGEAVAGPLEGHTGAVWSVAYSPDGFQVVSSSQDKTIRVWNATTGQIVAGPFEGHTDEVWCVAYSPDGSHIASGSDDETIRVWNATTGEVVAGPFQGHTDSVITITYSPDGSLIVSGSKDMTIRVWNAATGQLVGDPFQGHTENVWSVVYSPDGSHIISGSSDKTIRVWNPNTGQLVAGPFKGHADSINSVAYSPDGSHFISGSWDRTIKVWKVQDLISFGDSSEKDSWIQSSNGGCFGWIAPWNRQAFHLPTHSVVIASNKSWQVHSDSFLVGDSWVSCWN